MRIQDAKKKLKALGMVLSKQFGEYRVNFSVINGGTEEQAYYTTDLDDAVGTAHAMYRSKHGKDA